MACEKPVEKGCVNSGEPQAVERSQYENIAASTYGSTVLRERGGKGGVALRGALGFPSKRRPAETRASPLGSQHRLAARQLNDLSVMGCVANTNRVTCWLLLWPLIPPNNPTQAVGDTTH